MLHSKVTEPSKLAALRTLAATFRTLVPRGDTGQSVSSCVLSCDYANAIVQRAKRIMEPAVDASDKAFTGSIPQIYDRLLVPMIFEPYALDLARRASSSMPSRFARNGSRHRCARQSAGIAFAGYCADCGNLNEPMLGPGENVLRAITRSTGDRRTPWHSPSTTTASTPWPAIRRDVLPDKVKGYAEARRVLKPGGRFFFNVWDRIEENDFPTRH